MLTPRRLLGASLLLTAVACQPTTDGPSPSDLAARLDATEQRLASIESKLDALGTTLDETDQKLAPLVGWAELEKKKEEERSARRKEREEQREERRLSRHSFAESLAASETEVSESRVVDGAAEGIECAGIGTPKVECRIDRALLDEILANPEKLARQARVVPSVKDGDTRGYKLYGIRSGSLPKLLGMKNGDTIRGANGSPLGSIEEAMDVYSELRTAKAFALDIERKGKAYSLTIAIEE